MTRSSSIARRWNSEIGSTSSKANRASEEAESTGTPEAHSRAAELHLIAATSQLHGRPGDAQDHKRKAAYHQEKAKGSAEPVAKRDPAAPAPTPKPPKVGSLPKPPKPPKPKATQAGVSMTSVTMKAEKPPHRIVPSGGSSQKYGPCEVCKQSASDIQIYAGRPDGKVTFGHKECLEKLRSKEIHKSEPTAILDAARVDAEVERRLAEIEGAREGLSKSHLDAAAGLKKGGQHTKESLLADIAAQKKKTGYENGSILVPIKHDQFPEITTGTIVPEGNNPWVVPGAGPGKEHRKVQARRFSWDAIIEALNDPTKTTRLPISGEEKRPLTPPLGKSESDHVKEFVLGLDLGGTRRWHSACVSKDDSNLGKAIKGKQADRTYSREGSRGVPGICTGCGGELQLDPAPREVNAPVHGENHNEHKIEKGEKMQKSAKPSNRLNKGFYKEPGQGRYENVVFQQGDDADEALEIADKQGEEAAVKHLMQWHNPGEHETSDELSAGGNDFTFESEYHPGYILSYKPSRRYIGLEFDTQKGMQKAELLAGARFHYARVVRFQQLLGKSEDAAEQASKAASMCALYVAKMGGDPTKGVPAEVRDCGPVNLTKGSFHLDREVRGLPAKTLPLIKATPPNFGSSLGEEERRRDETPIHGHKDLGLKLMSWHSSMHDPIYGTGSTFHAGKPVPKWQVQATLDNISKLHQEAQTPEGAQRGGWGPAEVRELGGIKNHLTRLLKTPKAPIQKALTGAPGDTAPGATMDGGALQLAEDAKHGAKEVCAECKQPISYHQHSRKWNHSNTQDSEKPHQNVRVRPEGWASAWHKSVEKAEVIGDGGALQMSEDSGNYKGFRIEKFSGHSARPATLAGLGRGEGTGGFRKEKGLLIHLPDGGTKLVPTMKHARQYIDNYGDIQKSEKSDVIGEVGKSGGKPLDIGDGYHVHAHGFDDNGNHSVWVSKGSSRARKIQSGNLPSVHSQRGAGEKKGHLPITKKIAEEIKDYHRKYHEKPVKKTEPCAPAGSPLEKLNAMIKGAGGASLSKATIPNFSSSLNEDEQRRDETPIIGHKDLGLKLMNWHSSGSDPVYGTGSTFYSGKPVPRWQVQATLDNISKLHREAQTPEGAQRGGWGPADVRELGGIKNHLTRLLKMPKASIPDR